MAAYNAARTPLASVALTGVPTASTNALTPRGVTATSTTNAVPTPAPGPSIQGGVSSLIELSTGVAKSETLNKARGSSSSTPAGSAPPPTPATVTLNYSLDRAGDLVWVQALNGGEITATDDTGKVYRADNEAGGLMLTINNAGAVAFTFQALAASDVYRVYTRLDNVATTLLFEVPDPNP